MNKFVFYLMTFKGLHTLERVCNEFKSDIFDYIVVGSDSNVENDYSKDIIDFCIKRNIKFYKRGSEPALQAKYCFAISWRWLIETPSETNVIVLHESLLPKYRGFAPLVNQLINKETKLGVTALYATREYDRGDILLQKNMLVNYPAKINDVIKSISVLYGEIICDVLKLLLSGQTPIAIAQIESEASFSLWRNEDDYKINWNDSATDILRFVDAVGYPYSGASTYMDEEKIRIEEVQLVPDVKIENRTPGKLIFMDGGYPVIVCGVGLLKIMKAVYDDSEKSIFPLTKFRIRFK